MYHLGLDSTLVRLYNYPYIQQKEKPMFTQMISTTSLAVFDNTFAGRFFAVGNPYTGAIFGKPATFNEAWDDLESNPNYGNANDIMEVDSEGNNITKIKSC